MATAPPRERAVTPTLPALALDALVLFAMILARYFLIAGGCFLLIYGSWSGQTPRFGVGETPPSAQRMRRDIRLSVQSAMVFAVGAALLVAAIRMGITRVYPDPAHYGWGYLALSYGAVLVIQDAYFYFTHRLFHHRRLFRRFHAAHHQSRQPTPWTSFAFDTVEAAVQALFLLVIVFLLPLHMVTLMAVLATMSIWAVINHLGLDRLPGSFPHGWLGRWFIGPAHHSLHHEKYDVHFGLYFTFWDRFLGTEDPDYAFRYGPGGSAGGTVA